MLGADIYFFLVEKIFLALNMLDELDALDELDELDKLDELDELDELDDPRKLFEFWVW